MTKLSKISLAVVVACGGLAAAPAFAVGITANGVAYSAASTQDIYISGASAQDNGILGIARKICTAGTLAHYAISNNNVYFCAPNTAFYNPAGKTLVAIYKYAVGGSGSGVGPVALGQQLPFLDLTKITTGTGGNCTTAAPTFTNTDLPAYTRYNCGASSLVTTNAVTKIGFSDMEPAFFVDRPTSELLTTRQITSLVFGVPVSLKARNKLQAYQGLTVGSDDQANMPSLSTAQLTSIFTQPGQAWSAIGYPMGVAVGASTDILDDTIYVARRVNSSGTQKTFEALVARATNADGFRSCPDVSPGQDYNGFGNGTDDLNGEAEAVACGASPSQTFASFSGGSNLRTCLVNHNTNNRGAVGIITTEEVPGTAAWRFIKVDGVAPTLKNTAQGAYRLYTETSYQYLGATNVGNYATFINTLVTQFSDPNVIKTINGAFTQTWGRGGLMSLASNGGAVVVPSTDAQIEATPVNPWTRVVNGSLNNCVNSSLFN